MRFHARVGVLPHERDVAQPIEVDVSLTSVPAPADSLSDELPSVDYRDVYAIAEEIVCSGHTGLIEQIATRISDRLAQLKGEGGKRIRSTRVAVRKPHAPLAGPIDYAEVVIERDIDA
jgi:dihydroneopterin aldolase